MAGRDGASDERGRLVADPFDYRVTKQGGVIVSRGGRVGHDGRRRATPRGSSPPCSARTIHRRSTCWHARAATIVEATNGPDPIAGSRDGGLRARARDRCDRLHRRPARAPAHRGRARGARARAPRRPAARRAVGGTRRRRRGRPHRSRRPSTARWTGVDVVYYLVHSMGGQRRLRGDRADDRPQRRRVGARARRAPHRVPRRAASRGRRALAAPALPHAGRARSCSPPACRRSCCRPGVIIGSGSTSFEMIRHLTEVLPYMPAPRWVRSFIQPIAVRDVLHYLIARRRACRPRSTARSTSAAPTSPLRPAHERLRGRGRAAAAPDRGPARAHAVARRPVGEPRDADPAPARRADHRVAAVRLRHARARHRRRHPAAARGAAAVPHRRCGSRSSASATARSRRAGATPRSRARRATRCRATPTGRATRSTSTSASGARRRRRRDLWRVIEGVGGENGWYSFPLAWAMRGWVDKLTGGVGPAARPARPRHAARRRRRRLLARRGDRPRQLPAAARRDAGARAGLARARSAGCPDARARTTASAPCSSRRASSGRLYWWAIFPFHGIIFAGMANRITAEAEAAARARELGVDLEA